MTDTLKNRATLLTGGSGPLWHAIVCELLHAGVRLEMTFRAQDELDALFTYLRAQKLPAAGQPLIPIKVDDLKTTQLEWTPSATQRDFGRVEFWINLFDGKETVQRILTNVEPLMKKRHFGGIVHVARGDADSVPMLMERIGALSADGIQTHILVLPTNSAETPKPEETARKVVELLAGTIVTTEKAKEPAPPTPAAA